MVQLLFSTLVCVGRNVGRSVGRKTVRSVERAVARLKREGRIQFTGPKKEGRWETLN